jgi:hypothetical protein
MRKTLLALAVSLATRTAGAQAPRRCPAIPSFDFQVDRVARFIPDSTLLFFPADRAGRESMKFTVDTAGTVDARSIEFLRTFGNLARDSIIAESARWRFTPATDYHGLKACQVVQVTVERAKR